MGRQELGLYSRCDVLDSFADEFNAALNALVMIASKDGKEGELTVKLKVNVGKQYRFGEDDKIIAEWKEPALSWDISRKVKESKYKMSGIGGHDFMLKFDGEGKPYLLEASPQITIDELLKQINDKTE